MSQKEIAEELRQCLKLYAIGQDEKYLVGILTYASMLVGTIK